MNYQHILFATDLSEQSNIVAERTLSIAKKNNAKISILHIFIHSHLNYLGGEYAVPVENQLDVSLHQKAELLLRQQAQRLEIPAADQYIEVGFPKPMITDFAKQINADLIIVGRHDESWWGIFFGTVANSVLNRMSCDVLAVTVPLK